MCQLFELAEAAGDLVPRQPQQALDAEVLDRERRERAAINDGPGECPVVQVLTRCQVAEKTAREGVACSRGIEDRFERHRRCGEEATALTRHQDAVLASL